MRNPFLTFPFVTKYFESGIVILYLNGTRVTLNANYVYNKVQQIWMQKIGFNEEKIVSKIQFT